MQHHFVAAIVPPPGAPWHYQLTTSGNEYQLAVTAPSVPKAGVVPGLDLTGYTTTPAIPTPTVEGRIERRWVPMNDLSAWYRCRKADGKITKTKFYIR